MARTATADNNTKVLQRILPIVGGGRGRGRGGAGRGSTVSPAAVGEVEYNNMRLASYV